jgi:hypothetical protein
MPSTAIKDIAYDPVRRTLDVTFISNGRRYRYFEVTLDEYEELRHAFSKGAWFNTHIKPEHRYELLFEPSSA